MKVALVVAATAAVGLSIASSEQNAAAFVGAPRARLGAAKAVRAERRRSTSSLQMNKWGFGFREVRCVFLFGFVCR